MMDTENELYESVIEKLGESVEGLVNALVKEKDRANCLQKILDDAPHGVTCGIRTANPIVDGRCDCWKSKVPQ